MANTVPVTQKPIAETVDKEAYLLGLQDNGSGQQALYRMPIKKAMDTKLGGLKFSLTTDGLLHIETEV